MHASYPQITLVILIFQSTICRSSVQLYMHWFKWMKVVYLFSLQRKFTLFLHPSMNSWCFSSTPFFFLSPCVSFLYPLKCLASTFAPTSSVVFFTIHSELENFKTENWGLGFKQRYLIAPFSMFENLIYFMIFHKNVFIFCFNRRRWRKALWFSEYLGN